MRTFPFFCKTSRGGIWRKAFGALAVACGFCIFALGALCLAYHAFFYFTEPSWDELSRLISRDKIEVIGSRHNKYDGYHAEFEIGIPREADRAAFVSAIERIGRDSLLEAHRRPNGEMEYSFPINESGIWVRVSGKGGGDFLLSIRTCFRLQTGRHKRRITKSGSRGRSRRLQ